MRRSAPRRPLPLRTRRGRRYRRGRLGWRDGFARPDRGPHSPARSRHRVRMAQFRPREGHRATGLAARRAILPPRRMRRTGRRPSRRVRCARTSPSMLTIARIATKRSLRCTTSVSTLRVPCRSRSTRRRASRSANVRSSPQRSRARLPHDSSCHPRTIPAPERPTLDPPCIGRQLVTNLIRRHRPVTHTSALFCQIRTANADKARRNAPHGSIAIGTRSAVGDTIVAHRLNRYSDRARKNAGGPIRRRDRGPARRSSGRHRCPARRAG